MAEQRPVFVVSASDVAEVSGRYTGDDEVFSFGRAIGKAVGLQRIGVHLERLPPGHRTSYPHAESDEEEFVYVIEGEVELWLDGELHPMRAGDFAGFVAGTGIAHTVINDSRGEAVLLVGGERTKKSNRIHYPLNPGREKQLGEEWWDEVPPRKLGPHDGKPRRL
jgi:uncharacterized cupin superfamily protein